MERLVPQRQVFNHPAGTPHPCHTAETCLPLPASHTGAGGLHAGEEPFRKHDHPELQVNMEPQISRSDCEKVSRRQRHYEEQRLLVCWQHFCLGTH